MITQLRDMRLAWQSAKMTMKDHQKPAVLVVMEVVDVAIAVVKGERESGRACQVFHGCLPGVVYMLSACGRIVAQVGVFEMDLWQVTAGI
jgi:hypothetical protein